ncbi:hypothetical protein F2Q68_00023795 [Brassica cretica]|uniref:non-specific serine/threonine protein kinase n=1 Tax=Brassica cretica TaxID=69181 RepID=A0A8S9IBN1_BRACR|nr:hypothetical protein F2Q68_00023795 [Brassica cretica]
MGNCCGTAGSLIVNEKLKKGLKLANPFSIDYGHRHDGEKLVVLKEPTGREIKLRYKLGRELGRGEFGVTYLCTDNETGDVFACKSILKKKLRTAVDIDDVRREAEIMRIMPEHPNIVTLKETYEDDKAVHLVMELCEGGELFDRIVARGHYTERAAASVVKTIMEVVQVREKFNEIVGSPYYMAPEVLKQSYGPEIDIWSAGVILYILLCGVPPFWAETDHGVAKAILKSVIDFRRDPLPKVSSNAKDLIKRMLHPDPKRRLTAQQVLDHPWIQDGKNASNVSLGESVRARLKQFTVMNKLKKRALRVIAEHLSVEEASGIIERFQVMDTSNRGKITIQELRLGLRKLGIVVPQDDIQILMDAGDVDKDGYIDVNEFVAISVHIRKMGNDEHLKKAFKFFDLDKSGYIEIDELRDALADEFDTTSEEVVEAIIYDVDTNKMCHKHGVMHRDLKPENFLFANKKETASLKAIDFGLSVFFKPGERFNEIVGSPYYMAPEVLKQSYGPEIDIWSAGVILYILLCGVPPFWAETDHGVAKAILRSVIDFRRDPWPKVSANAKDLIKKMLHPDPKRRLTAQQVLEHPWLQDGKNAPNVSLGETVRARLKQFTVMNKLKKRALRVIAEHLSVEEASGIKERFQVMDTSNRGKITIEELRIGLRKLGIIVPQEDIQILMDAGDVDKDGYLDVNEFVAISVHIRKMGSDEHLKTAFSFFDQNKNGYIEIEELREALANEFDTTSEEVVEAIILDVDTNKDGRISYEEFATMMKTGTDWRKASKQFSRDRFKNLSERFNEIVGSPYYMAPEVLKQSYGPEIDIWSAGVILYILLCGVPPFWAETDHGVAKAILRSVIDFRRDPWPKVSANAKDLIKKMLHPDPKRRLTAQQVLEHPWLQDGKNAPNVSLGETVRARLKQFTVMNKLKKRALRVIAEHLSVEEASGIKERFQVMDTSNRGKITIDELRIGLRKLGIVVPQDDIQILMDAGDVDKDGYLDVNEFVAISVHIRKMGNDEHLKTAFTFFDQNRSGYIEIEELREALANEFDTASEEVVEAIILDVDTNKDGRISYEEFATMMKTGTDWRKASKQFSRDRFKNLSIKLKEEGSLNSNNRDAE